MSQQTITKTIRTLEQDIAKSRERARHIHEKAEDSEAARRELATRVRQLMAGIEQDEVNAALDDMIADTSARESQVADLRNEESKFYRKAQAQQAAYVIIQGETTALERKLRATKLRVTEVYAGMLDGKITAARVSMAELMVCLARSQGTPLAAISPVAVFNRKVISQNILMASSDPEQMINVVARVAEQMSMKIGA